MTGVEAILTRLGWETAVEHQGAVHRVKAVVQPIHDRSKLYLEADYSALGQLEKGPPLPPAGGLYPLWGGTLFCEAGGELLRQRQGPLPVGGSPAGAGGGAG